MRKWMDGVAFAVLASLVGAASAAGDAGQKVWDAAMAAARTGPVDVPLLDEAVLHLPAGEVFVPQPQADRLLNLIGNPGANPDMPGVILPRDPAARWIMPVRFQKSGYIKDDDARTWDANAMLRSLRIGTEEQNQERRKVDVPSIEVVDWSEPPHYDAGLQRLSWAMTSRVIGARPDDPLDVNYNTYALGRDGYFSMNLVTTLSSLRTLKPVAGQQIAALAYNPGKRYADFDPRTDRVAGYGLVGLVVGAAENRDSPVARMIAGARQHAVPLIAGLLLLAAAGVALSRRRDKASASPPAPPGAPFVNTVAESPARAQKPAVDLDLGDGPAPPRGA